MAYVKLAYTVMHSYPSSQHFAMLIGNKRPAMASAQFWALWLLFPRRVQESLQADFFFKRTNAAVGNAKFFFLLVVVCLEMGPTGEQFYVLSVMC